MLGDQRLVGGHYRLAGLERGLDRRQRRFAPRFLAFERAVTATTRTGRPQRDDSVRLCCSIKRTTSAPTVPSPAIPTFRGATMTEKNLPEVCPRETRAAMD